MTADEVRAEIQRMAAWLLPCGPDCRWRYGWCFTHNISTGTGAEPWRPSEDAIDMREFEVGAREVICAQCHLIHRPGQECP
jgi:hypothetical protein